MSNARQAILPFFIPMSGCSYRCVYCDQHSISGAQAPPAPDEVKAAALAYGGSRPAQLAFYGGSFTALPREEQRAYLQAAQPALERGIIDSIRISTRPDAVDEDKLAWLSGQGVRTVELGIQSFDAAVLKQAGRAYSPEEAARACELVRESGLTLGIQLMTGLPGDNRANCLHSMRRSLELQPVFLRIYPTLVLRDTPLALLWQSGRYTPQSLEDAAALAGDMLALARAAAIPVIRLGLNPSQSLEEALLAGPYHPAFGQLAQGALKLAQARMLLQDAPQAQTLYYPPRERSLLCGQKNSQLIALLTERPGLAVEAAPQLESGMLAVEGRVFSETEFLRRYLALF